MPYPGAGWQPQEEPAHQPHEYERNGTAKLLTLFHPASGQARVKGVRSSTNQILHGWLKAELTDILAALPPPSEEMVQMSSQANRTVWESWREGLGVRVTLCEELCEELPPLRVLLVMDNLVGHTTPQLLVWMFQHGILPLYTPLSGSWLNMAESFQRIVKRRALDGQYPQTPEEIIEWLEATARGWNAEPTPFEWGGKRAGRRARSRQRRQVLQSLGGSGACTRRAIRFRRSNNEKWRFTCQVTH
jgi:DDE superfamily endonuclease